MQPSLNRDWATDQAILAYATIEEDNIHIKNIRNFTYRTETEYIPNYYDKTFNLNDLESVWYVVEPFSDWKGAAHTFLSFGFKNGDYLAISAEIRKENGESFSALKGLLNQYEIVYIIGDENDLIKLRSNYRRDDVYLYPVKTTPEKQKELFLSMLERNNKLATNPEFYNTLTNTCTTNIVKHVNRITPQRIPFNLKILAPGYSDQLAYDLGLIDTELSFEEAREFFHINQRANQESSDMNFSEKIRATGGN